MSFLFVVYIPMKKKQQQKAPAERQPEPEDMQTTDAPDTASVSSVHPVVEKVKQDKTEEERIEDEDYVRDELSPVYGAKKERASVVIRDQTKDPVSPLPMPDLPDVLDDSEINAQTSRGGLYLDEVSLSCLHCVHVVRERKRLKGRFSGSCISSRI